MAQTAHFKDTHHPHPEKQDEETHRDTRPQDDNLNLRKLSDKLASQLSAHNQGKIRVKLEQKGKVRHEEVNMMELKNAYKQCNIYKKEANFYRKKLVSYQAKQKSQEMFEWKAGQLEKENIKLREEIKYLLKINKKQEKGLESTSVEGYLSTAKEVDKLQEEIRKLKRQIMIYEKDSLKKAEGQQACIQSRLKNIFSIKDPQMRLQARARVHSELGDCSQLGFLKEKAERDNVRLGAVMEEKQTLREELEQCKRELARKDREIMQLRQNKAASMKNMQSLQSRGVHKKEGSLQSKLSRKVKPNSSFLVSDNRSFIVPKLQPQSRQKQFTVQDIRSSTSTSTRWSHSSFASKMKELHVFLHPQGHIRHLHAVYERGQPQIDGTRWDKAPLKSLKTGPGEHISHISGCFSEGHLQCLVVLTSTKRLQCFGNDYLLELDGGDDKFEYSLQVQDGFAVLEGQTGADGVTELSCRVIYY